MKGFIQKQIKIGFGSLSEGKSDAKNVKIGKKRKLYKLKIKREKTLHFRQNCDIMITIGELCETISLPLAEGERIRRIYIYAGYQDFGRR